MASHGYETPSDDDSAETASPVEVESKEAPGKYKELSERYTTDMIIIVTNSYYDVLSLCLQGLNGVWHRLRVLRGKLNLVEQVKLEV